MAGCTDGRRDWRRWWRRPRHIGKVEEIQRVRLRGVAVRQVRRRTDEAALDELENRGVVHRRLADVVLAHERRSLADQPQGQLERRWSEQFESCPSKRD